MENFGVRREARDCESGAAALQHDPMRQLSALLLGATLVTAQSAPGVDANRLPSRYVERATVRWASDAEGGAPFVFADPADPSREVGFEVDLAAAMADDLGVRF